MSSLLRRLWNDDQGAVISVELVLVIGILVFGIIPGLVALRNSVIASMATIGNILTRIIPSFTYSGYAILGTPTGPTIAVVQGYANTGTTACQLTGQQVAPLTNGFVVVCPAP